MPDIEVTTYRLEYLVGNSRITVAVDANEIRTCIYLNRHQSNPDITQLTTFSHYGVNFDDTMGAAPTTAIHRHGYGTLATNLTIQMIRRINNSSQDLNVTGKLSTVDDPMWCNEDKEEALRFLENRKLFWRQFGFKITKNEWMPRMSCKLRDLKLVCGKTTRNGIPVDISLNEFWHKGEAAPITSREIKLLAEIDLSRLAIPSHLRLENIERANKRLNRVRDAIIGTFVVTMAGLGICFTSLEAILASIATGVLMAGNNAWWSWVYPYTSAYRLSFERSKQRRLILDYIEEIEKDGGLAWRIRPVISQFIEELTLENVYQASFNGSWSSANENYYFTYIQAARSVLIKNNISYHKDVTAQQFES